MMTDISNIHRIIRSYYKQLYTNKQEGLKKGYISGHHYPKLNKEFIKNLNRFKTGMETESVVKFFSTKRIPGPDGFAAAAFYQGF